MSSALVAVLAELDRQDVRTVHLAPRRQYELSFRFKGRECHFMVRDDDESAEWQRLRLRDFLRKVSA